MLKWGVLALLYLFFFRAMQVSWAMVGPKARTQSASLRTAQEARAAQGPASRSAVPTAVSQPQRAGASTVPTLAVVAPPELVGRSFEVSNEVTIGRALDCDVVLENTFVSQHHARIRRDPNGLLVEDLGSTNGTSVNGAKVTAPLVAAPGASIQVGGVHLVFEQ